MWRPAGDTKALITYPFLTNPWVNTVGLTQTEIATLAGDRYSGEAIVTLDAGEKSYMQFTTPELTGNPLTDVLTVFNFRNIQSDDGIYFRVYWDATGITKGAAANTKNENQAFPKTHQTEWTLVTGTPVNLGTLVETVKSAPATGNPNVGSSAGEITPAAGFRMYDPERVALIELENRGGDGNEVIVTYSWAEVPRALLNY